MVEAINGLDDKDGRADKYEIAAQYAQAVQSNIPAGLSTPETPSCQSVGDISDSKESHSIETASEPLSGKLETISDTTLKGEAAPIDQQYSKREVDGSMKQDADGDGLVDGLDKKSETRAETATRLLNEQRSLSLGRNNKHRSILESGKTLASIKNTTKVQDKEDSLSLGGLLGNNKKNKEPGNIDVFGNSDDENKGIGNISFSMDTSN